MLDQGRRLKVLIFAHLFKIYNYDTTNETIFCKLKILLLEKLYEYISLFDVHILFRTLSYQILKILLPIWKY